MTLTMHGAKRGDLWGALNDQQALPVSRACQGSAQLQRPLDGAGSSSIS